MSEHQDRRDAETLSRLMRNPDTLAAVTEADARADEAVEIALDEDGRPTA